MKAVLRCRNAAFVNSALYIDGCGTSMHPHDDITPLVTLIENLVEQNAKLKRGLLALENIALRSGRTHLEREQLTQQMADLYAEVSGAALEIADILQSLNEATAFDLKAIPQSTRHVISLAEETMRIGLDRVRKSPGDQGLPVAAIIPFGPK